MSGHRTETAAVASEWSPLVVRLYTIAAVVVVAVVAAHGVRSTATHWLPVGDDAFLTLRSRAVFSSHPPLLSSASSAGADAAASYNHPGPAVLWFTAPFVKVLGSSGMALGVAALNGLAVAVVARVARLASRPAVAAGVLAATSGLVWAMGSQVLVDPWNPHVATLALLAALVGTWGVVQGVRVAAPFGVVAAAVAAQTHLSFVAVAVAAAVTLLVGLVVRARRCEDGDERRRWWRSGAVAIAAGVVVLVPTIVEQVAHGSDGNLTRILDGSGGGTAAATVSPTQAASVVAAVLTRPPWFLRGSWGMSMYATDLPDTTGAVLGLVVVTVLVGVACVLARRRRDGEVLGLLAVGTLAVVVGAGVSLIYPLRVGVPIAYFRWLWPAAALIAVGLAVPVLEATARAIDRRRSTRPDLVPIAALSLAALFALVNVVPANAELSGSDRWGQELSLTLLDQAAPRLRRLDGPVEVVPSLQEGPLMAFTGALMDDLDAHGVDVRSADPVIVQQVGAQHRATGSEPWVLVMVGPDTSESAGPRGGERVGVVSELSPAERRSLERDLHRAEARLDGATAVLTEAGRAAADPALDALAGPIGDPDRFLHDRVLADALDHDLVRVEGRDGAELGPAPLAELSRRAFHADGRTFALWLVPRADWETS